MSSSTYPTRQPGTTAAIEAARAAFITSLPSHGVALGPSLLKSTSSICPAGAGRVEVLATHPAPRTARVIVREKVSDRLIDRMAADMRAFGEGMTRTDLKRLGYTESQIEDCAEEANRRALARAGLN